MEKTYSFSDYWISLLSAYEELGLDRAVQESAPNHFLSQPLRHSTFASRDLQRKRLPSNPLKNLPEPLVSSPSPAIPAAPFPPELPGESLVSTKNLPSSPSQMSAPIPPFLSSEGWVAVARTQAEAANSLEELKEAWKNFEGCSLKATATQIVFKEGDPQSPIVFIGEAPGAEEDKQGVPFVGRAGKLFNLMLESIQLKRGEVYITNMVPWRPPGNRTPTPQENALCLPFVERQIALVQPKIIVSLGGSATQTLLNTKEGIMRLRGKWFDYTIGERTMKLLPTLHPAYLLRQPAHKALAWQDFREISQALQKITATENQE